MNEPESFPPTVPRRSAVPTAPPPVAQHPYAAPSAGAPAGTNPAGIGTPTQPVGASGPSGGANRSGPPVWVWLTAAAVVITMISLVGLYFVLSRDSATAAHSPAAQGQNGPDAPSQSAADESDPSSVPSPSQSQAPGDSAASPAVTEKVGQWFHAGTYQLPGEMPPGLYRVGTEWWMHDEVGDLVENSSTRDGTTLLLIPENAPRGDVDLSGGAWLVDRSKPLDALQYLDGTYLVGVDIQPGTYRLTGVKNMSNVAYAARLDENLAVIDNHVETASDADNVVTMEVLPTDFAFDFTGRIEKIG